MKTIVGEGIHFERIRRITGYLVGGLERFNDAKRAEERDRLKHVHVKNIIGGSPHYHRIPDTD